MDQKIDNHLKGGNVEGDYVGGNQTKNYYISMFQDSEREFVVTSNANIKPVYYFTGRETELQNLRQRIEDGRKSVLVSGMGGIGKTHICRKLFEEYEIRNGKGENISFSHIGYIEYNGDMDSSLQGCLRYKEQEKPEANCEAAWKELEYLAADGKLLLFVDNVDRSISSDQGLQRLKSIPGAIVLTSRRTSFCKEFEPVPISFLNTKQCIVIYERIRYEDSDKKVPEEELQDLEYVIKNMAARHTITVELLAHFAETKRLTVKELREELERKGFRLEYKDEEDKLINIQEEYEKLYDLSGLSAAEQNILEAFSVFPYISLAAKTCNEWLLADAGGGKDDDILVGLYRKGWLQFDLEQESYVLHPVFAQFIFEKCKPKLEEHSGLIHSCEESLKIPESGSPLVCQQYLPFAENIINKINMGEDVNQIMFIISIAYLLQYIAEYKKAEELCEKVLRISRRVLGEEHPSTVACYNNLAMVYRKQGEYRKAEELYEKSLGIWERVLGEEHPDTARSYNNLAFVYVRQGEYAKAQELYEKSLGIRERVLGEKHPDTAGSWNNLASVYERQGEYAKAQELYEKSLGIRERVLGEEHPDTARSYNNLASVYVRQGEYAKAQELYEKSLRIKKRVLGEGHPDIAISYNNLAEVYRHRGEYKIALDYYLNSYKVLKFRLGLNHPHTQIVFQNLKKAYSEWDTEGNFEQWLEENMEKEQISSS